MSRADTRTGVGGGQRGGTGPHVVVVGGGISGLAAAYRLGAAGARVTVLEGSDRLGGKLYAGEIEGVPVDLGAESMLARRPEAVALARAVGLGDRLQPPATAGASLWTRGRLRPMPKGHVMGVPGDLAALAASGVISPEGLAGIERERELAPTEVGEDVAVGAYVAARLGREVVDRLVEPLLGGVYAGDAYRISMRAAVPQLFEAARTHRSLLEGVRELQSRVGADGPGAPVFMGIDGGVGRLPLAVADAVRAAGGEVVTGAVVQRLSLVAGEPASVAPSVGGPPSVESSSGSGAGARRGTSLGGERAALDPGSPPEFVRRPAGAPRHTPSPPSAAEGSESSSGIEGFESSSVGEGFESPVAAEGAESSSGVEGAESSSVGEGSESPVAVERSESSSGVEGAESSSVGEGAESSSVGEGSESPVAGERPQSSFGGGGSGQTRAWRASGAAGWEVVVREEGGGSRVLLADGVVLAVPASEAARLLGPNAPAAAGELAAVEYASMALVTLAFRRGDVGGLPEGSGFLVPPVDGRTIKASTFSSRKWGWLGGDESGLFMLRTSIGRFGDEADLKREDADLVRISLDELRAATGLAARPVATRVTRWDGGLPQYPVGHLARVARIRERVAELPGLRVCGAAYDGVGIPACVASAHAAADGLWATLAEDAGPGERE
ncbi:protoporphyrinogen oxidase [Streptomyces pathocidini]|uniref:protoporphyrinogen oxidase n=1 Tax=Streptomyces pathocidini TaxID=1650571 RepID=UPI0033CD1738